MITTAARQELFDHLATGVSDLVAWAMYRDILDEEGAPTLLLNLADRIGFWRGYTRDWVSEGPLLVDRVPLVGVSFLDASPSAHCKGTHPPTGQQDLYPSTEVNWRWHLLPSRDDAIYWPLDPDDVRASWHNENLYQSEWRIWDTAQLAQQWLMNIALAYARRLRDMKPNT